MEYTWQYYDLVLLGVFASVATGFAVGALTGVSPTTSTLGFGLVAVGFIGHGLFVNGPVDDPGDLADEVDTLN
ncbi:hypothetical protein [Halosimplex amylolyticum]|uniref:hypothetical protein n=1 Tax=Halosimplex amylolyticum TaxID=3396616 RepID=UPI003F547A1F